MGPNRKLYQVSLVLLAGLVSGKHAPAQAPAEKLVEVETIAVKGTHLPESSVIRLSGIKPHDKVNDLIVNAACHKITATGLVKTVDYSYDVYPDRETVTLNLVLVDETGLLPASILPASDDAALWSRLQALDPLFKRQLPPTERALAFYAENLEGCLRAMGRPMNTPAPK
jgi:hypothetical protein